MGKSRDIDVIARPNANGGVDFHMEQDGAPTKRNGRHEVLLFDKQAEEMDADEVHRIYFTLENKGGARVAFTKNLVNVLWARKVDAYDDDCPDSAMQLPGEFFATEVSDNQKKLTVVNTNMNQGEKIAFRLNFVRKGDSDLKPGGKYIPYDPIGDNQNAHGLVE